MNPQDARVRLLTQWAQSLDRAARAGALTDGGRRINIQQVSIVSGPRAGALDISAGMDSEMLLSLLAKKSGIIARQFIPWDFTGEPSVYVSGRYVRVEAGWPKSLSEAAIKLSDLNARPHESGRWVAGKNERGRAITLSLSSVVPHFLLAGTTGSGKSVAIRSLISQLASHQDMLVLIDGKFGEGLRGLDHLAGTVGPLACSLDEARGALAWTLAEMDHRFTDHNLNAPRLVVVIDEVQEFMTDPAIIEMIRRIAAQGRAARVHLVLATQHPSVGTFGDASTKRNVTGRIALRVADAKSSEVAIGQSIPRADKLLGAGDAYAVVPGQIERVQIAYRPRAELDAMLNYQPRLSEWPDFAPEQIAQSRNVPTYRGEELGVALVNAFEERGRPALVDALEAAGLGRPGVSRATRLLKLGRAQYAWLQSAGWCLSDLDVYTNGAKPYEKQPDSVYPSSGQTGIMIVESEENEYRIR